MKSVKLGYSITVHGPDEFYDVPGYQLAEKIAGVSFICTIGKFARNQLMKISSPRYWSKFEIAPLGVDPERFAPRRESLVDIFEMICVGRLVPAKGQHILVAAMSPLDREGRKVRLRLVGDGPDRRSLEQQVQANGLTDSVIIEGAVNQDRIRSLYRAANLFVLPSFAEGIPVVLMEAMAMEIPVVTTFVNGIPELIRDGVDGRLVAPSDDEGAGRGNRRADGRRGGAQSSGTRRTPASVESLPPGPQHRASRGNLPAEAGSRCMKYLAFGLIAAATLCTSCFAAEDVVRIDTAVAVHDVPRFGVNLGFRTSWGAEQLMANVVMNPGFEGIVDRCLVTVMPLDRYRFLERSPQLARDDQFWAGATFEVRTGSAAGYTGRIVASRKKGASGLPEFTAANPLPDDLAPGDRIALTRTSDDDLPSQWWFPADSQKRAAVRHEARPGSAGVRSLELRGDRGAPAEVHSYLDAIGSRTGNLLPLAGRWRLSFWSRAVGGAGLSVRFGRIGAPLSLNRTVTPHERWRASVFEFDGIETGVTGTLDLSFQTEGNVLLDDVELTKVDTESIAFRHEAVELLRRLHPGYLRDWQGQLGDTLANRLAPPEGRRASRYRPGGDEATDFGYSLPEFLDLCRTIHARPWIVVSPAFSDQEWTDLGRYLRNRASEDAFPEILVEFGNENWNSIFSAAGIADPVRHAETASRGFRMLLQGAGNLHVRPVVNAQYANPAAVNDFASQLNFPAIVAVAPYFLYDLDARRNPLDVIPSLFAPRDEMLRSLSAHLGAAGHELASYEINLHTTGGSASGTERAPVVAGAASGSALAAHLLNGLAAGERRQCVYVLSGLDYKLSGNSGYVSLWGIARDLGPTRRFRPTGLALQMLNQAAKGDLYSAHRSQNGLTVAPFRSQSGWSVAIVSSSPAERSVRIEFPQGDNAPLPVLCFVLKSASPIATNEESEQVTIAQQPAAISRHSVTLVLPAYGFAILLPAGERES
jgi:Glycosyl transferases group 1